MPDCIPAPFKKMGGRSQICSYIRYFVCVGINGITAAHGHMEFYLGSRSRDLYAHAPRIYHGILSGEYDNGQRICCSDGEDAHSTKNRDSYVGGIPIFPHSQRGIYSHSGRYEDAWHHYLPQSHEDAGMVMQDVNHQLFTESTEEEMLISMAEPAPDKADAVLDRLDLLQFKERHPMALSGGQKQRVAIATALVSERKILVLDEPTSGLDLQHMKEVADELVTIQKMGKTSLVITHDYELIVSCCTHVLHLEHGMVQEQYAMDAAGLQRLQNFFIESR